MMIFYKKIRLVCLFVIAIFNSGVGFSNPIPPATTDYYTIMGGAFNSNIWSKASHVGATCTCSPCVCSPCTIPSNAIIHIKHAVTIACDISIGSNTTLIIENGGSLTVTGNASISGTGFFQIDAGGSAVVTGNFTVSGTGDATVNGSLTVNGNLTLASGAGSDICGSGTIAVGGTVTGIPDPCFTGSLPIELMYFNGNLSNKVVDLVWATASETNNDYFTIQRSANGVTWSNILIVTGAGTSSSLKEYQKTDFNPLPGTSYYRLKQTDYDGNSSESEIVAVQNNESNGTDIIPFPNPNEGNLIFLDVFGFDNEEIQIRITDILGSTIYNNIYPISGNTAQLNLALNNKLPAGTYCIVCSSSKNSICKKILIK